MKPKLKGVDLDGDGRCIHYHWTVDVVCIKYKCCNEYYACYQCHQQLTEHEPVRYSETEFDTKAVACGVCMKTVSINEYLQADECPHCTATWNPNCANHYSLYFNFNENSD